MRQGKRRGAKRAVEFFVLSAGFKQPYQILLDGNFIHTAMGFKMENLQKRLGDLLRGTDKRGVKLCVTPCILAELKALGSEFKETYQWARQDFFQIDCHHTEDPLQPDECIQSVVGLENEGHYFTATQDPELRDSLGKLLGGATLFISVNGLHISQPTAKQQSLAKEGVADSMLPNEDELKSDALGGLKQWRPTLKTSSKFKKAKKGGPNPLSVKPASRQKKKRPGPRLRNALKAAALEEQSKQQQAEGGEGTVKKKNKRRKHSKTVCQNEAQAMVE